MKKIITILSAVIITISAYAQVPQKMSYQAVIRNSSNTLITNTTVGMRISILKDSATGTAVYVETQTPMTNANGLASLLIGTGTVVTGTFSSINWATGIYFLKTETDPTGGTSYSITGTSQLLSVPYALCAKTVENENDTMYWKVDSTGIHYDSGKVGINTLPAQYRLTVAGIGTGVGSGTISLSETNIRQWLLGSGLVQSGNFSIVNGSSSANALTIDGTSNNIGIGTTSPTSKLQVIGLPVYANNAAAITGGLTAGAFYRTGSDPDVVCVVH